MRPLKEKRQRHPDAHDAREATRAPPTPSRRRHGGRRPPSARKATAAAVPNQDAVARGHKRRHGRDDAIARGGDDGGAADGDRQRLGAERRGGRGGRRSRAEMRFATPVAADVATCFETMTPAVHVLQEDDASSPTPQKSSKTVFASPSSGRRPADDPRSVRGDAATGPSACLRGRSA